MYSTLIALGALCIIVAAIISTAKQIIEQFEEDADDEAEADRWTPDQ